MKRMEDSGGKKKRERIFILCIVWTERTGMSKLSRSFFLILLIFDVYTSFGWLSISSTEKTRLEKSTQAEHSPLLRFFTRPYFQVRIQYHLSWQTTAEWNGWEFLWTALLPLHSLVTLSTSQTAGNRPILQFKSQAHCTVHSVGSGK